MSIHTKEGAEAFQALLHAIADKGAADLEVVADVDTNGPLYYDSRDYRAMSEMILTDLQQHLIGDSSPGHRQGYLRALTDWLSVTADGAVPGEDWDPLKNTAAAFAAHGEARGVVARAGRAN